ncbi:MAG: serine hydrolase domain-containing protein [Acidimicrobiales bacterium]
MHLSYDVVEPSTVGVDPGAVEALLERARREVDDGLLPSCQVAMAREGRLVAEEVYGEATSTSRYVVFSATKGVVAGAIWLLVGNGELDVAQRVAEIVPEFGSNGKDRVTVEQLLTHTSGFPRAPMPRALWLDRAARLERFGRWRLNWDPGSQYEYHPTSAHWVLAEVIERISGTDFRRFVHDRLLGPLGLRGPRLGVAEADQGDVTTLVAVGEPATPEELEAALGVSSIDTGEVTEELLLGFNDARVREAGVPGAGGIARASDLALYYQALLNNPRQLWNPAVLEDGTGRIRSRFPDPMLGVPANRSLGLVVAGDDGQSHLRSNLGRTVSPRAFGHAGAGGQIAWADPATGLSFAYVTNGLDANLLREARRSTALSSRAAVCLTDEVA